MRRRQNAFNDAAKKLPLFPKSPKSPKSPQNVQNASLWRPPRATPPKPLRREEPEKRETKRRFDLEP